MEVTVNRITDCDQEIQIQLTHEELVPHFDEAYQKAVPMLEIRGFRKGKAPLSLVKKMYGDIIEQDALGDIANDTFKKIIEERKIQPLGTPTMIDLKYSRGEPFSFKIKFEVKPEFELKEYKGIEIEKVVHPVTPEEIEGELKRLQHSNATYEEAKKVDGIEYIVSADLQELDETGSPLVGRKNDHQRIYLNEPTTEAEIKETLKNAEVGGVYHAKFEHAHGDHQHKVNLQMTVKKIEKVIHPPFDEVLVKKITGGKTESVETFKKELEEDLVRYWTERTDRQLADSITNELVRRHDFSVPEVLVQGIIDSNLDDLRNRQPNKQFPKTFNEKQYRETLRPSAIWQAKWMLVREKLMEREKLDVTDTDIEATAEQESKRLGIGKEDLLKFYKGSDQARERLLSTKLMDFLKSNAKIKEVTESAGKNLATE